MPTITAVYNKVLPHQSYVLSASALDINTCDFYSIILKNYRQLEEEKEVKQTEFLPIQSSIYMIQKMYLDLVETDSINIMGVDVRFTDSYWNFSALYKDGKVLNGYRYNFEPDKNRNLSDYQVILLKLYAMFLITEKGIHCGSNCTNFSKVKKLFEYMYDNGIVLIENLTVQNLKDMFSEMDINYATMVKIRRHIKEFLSFYSLIATDVYTKEFNDYFTDVNTDKINAIIEENKVKLLPSPFYMAYSNALYDAAINPELSIIDRGLYGLLYIGTQTGLRGGELTILEADCLKVYKYKGKQLGILRYRSTKNGGKNKVYSYAETNASQKTINVITVLQELYKEERNNRKSNLLVVNVNDLYDGRKLNESIISVKESKLQRYSQKFVFLI